MKTKAKTSASLRTFVSGPPASRRFAGVGVLCCLLVSGAFHAWSGLAALGVFAALRLKWIAEHLALGSWTHISNLLGAEGKRERSKTEN